MKLISQSLFSTRFYLGSFSAVASLWRSESPWRFFSFPEGMLCALNLIIQVDIAKWMVSQSFLSLPF